MQGRKTRTQKYCPCLSHTLTNSTEFERKSKYLLNQQLSSIHNYFIMLLIINYHLRKWNWAWNDFQPLCPQKKLLLSYYSPLCTKEFLLIRWLPRLIASSTFSLIIPNVRGTARKSISHRGERKSHRWPPIWRSTKCFPSSGNDGDIRGDENWPCGSPRVRAPYYASGNDN